ncbi:4-coumarate--CoA ligase-like 5 [Nymphaea thermarum]|nr:4-coumarate--CoA ligase-like 5 [Nymphaea thermarum]
MAANQQQQGVNPRSGFCPSNSIFYSKRKPVAFPVDDQLDVATFISSRAHSGKIALIDAETGEQITYPQLWSMVHSLADGLSSVGVRQGDVVLILSPNSIHFPIVFLAVMSLGAILTTTNPINTAAEIAKQVRDSRPSLAFTTPSLLPKLKGTNLPVILLNHDADTETLPTTALKIVTTIAGLLNGRHRRCPRPRIHQDDTATLLYSSGTTGLSKGVISSHRNLIAMVSVIMGRFRLDSGDGLETFLCTVPMFHVYGLAAFASGLLGSGGTIVVLSRFDMGAMLEAIQRYRVTYLPLVPPILVALAKSPEVRRFDLGSLRKVLSGGAPLGRELMEEFLARFPSVSVLQGYGLTESTGIGASTDTADESRRYGTAGLLSANMEARIVDPETGEALEVNQKGELWMRGPSIMKGYFSNPEATASTLDSEGWLRTGDLCYIDEDGYIFVVDRLKELIKYKGYQVAPAELEALLHTHPDISDAAVIPFPDKEVGQYPVAFVVRKAGTSVTEDAIIKFVAQQVAPYKKIRRVSFVSEVPKNASGKILRKDLIKLATNSRL